MERRARRYSTERSVTQPTAAGRQELQPATVARFSSSHQGPIHKSVDEDVDALRDASRLLRQSGAAALLKRITILSIDCVVAPLLLFACIAQPGALSAAFLALCLVAAMCRLYGASPKRHFHRGAQPGYRCCGVDTFLAARLLQVVVALWLVADFICQVGASYLLYAVKLFDHVLIVTKLMLVGVRSIVCATANHQKDAK